MSLKIQQILDSAKQLATRLREDDNHADSLISQAQAVLDSVDGIKEYQDELEDLNTAAHHRPRSVLVRGIQQEKRHIRELQRENCELQAALEETQNALDMVMSKYREQVSKLTKVRNLERLPQHQVMTVTEDALREKVEKIVEMGAVMNRAIEVDQEDGKKEQELMTQLLVENKGLRELLEIAVKYGSVQPNPSSTPVTPYSFKPFLQDRSPSQCSTDDEDGPKIAHSSLMAAALGLGDQEPLSSRRGPEQQERAPTSVM